MAAIVLSEDPLVLKGAVAIASIFLFQFLFNFFTQRFPRCKRVAYNMPLLLMDQGEFIDERGRPNRALLLH